MKRWFLGFGVLVVVIGVASFVIFHKDTVKANGKKTVIQISASGFSPSTIVVKAGTQIVWKNVDSAPHAVASNPYPKNSSVKDLHSQTILPDGSYAYLAAKEGTINYHDDTQPTHNASIKVEK